MDTIEGRMRSLEDPDRAKESRRAFLWGMGGALTLLPSLHAVYLAGWELGEFLTLTHFGS